MRYKKAQTWFVIIGIVILMLFAFSFVYQLVLLKNQEEGLNAIEVSSELRPLYNHMDTCYSYQQKCVLLKAGIIKELKSLGHYEDYFKNFVVDNSLECAENRPENSEQEFITDPKVKKVRLTLAKEQTTFSLSTKQKVRIKEGATQTFDQYRQEQNIRFLNLYNHTFNINKSKKVQFHYLKKIPINQEVQETKNGKRYIQNDTKSDVQGRQYLFIYEQQN